MIVDSDAISKIIFKATKCPMYRLISQSLSLDQQNDLIIY